MTKVEGQAFKKAIQEAAPKNSHGAFVEIKQDYDDYECFVGDGGLYGVAIAKDGDIISVFKNPIFQQKGVADVLIEFAKQKGGKKLDCFDGFLTKLYSKFGFKEKTRMTWDDQYAPNNWNYERDGRPDVVMMEL
jgi:GNAT superfamily N-acetyltransferase